MSVLASVTTHRELVTNLVLRDVRSRYKQSVLGYAWAVFNPFILALVYSAIIGFLGQPTGKLPIVVYSFYGLLFFNLFATGVGGATEGLVSHISLITKVYFPREVFPISAVISKLVDFGFGLAGLAALLLFYRVVPSWQIIAVIPLLATQLLLMMGIGMLCACANLFYRDVRYLVQLTLGVVAYFVPNLYTLEQVKRYSEQHGHWIYKLYLSNPMATLVEATRRAAFPGTSSSSPTGPMAPFSEVAALGPYLIWAVLISVVVFFVGFRVFKAYEPRFAEFV